MGRNETLCISNIWNAGVLVVGGGVFVLSRERSSCVRRPGYIGVHQARDNVRFFEIEVIVGTENVGWDDWGEFAAV